MSQQPTQGPALPGGKASLYIVGAEERGTLGNARVRPRANPPGRGPDAYFRGHHGRLTAAAVSPNGRYVVSGDEHGTVKAWDLLRPLRCRDLELKLRGGRTG